MSKPMRFVPTEIPEVLLLESDVYADERGFFMEVYQCKRFAAAGIDCSFVQDNQSGSKRGILRGLHYQIRQPQAKLVRVVQGEAYDVAVDLRRSAPTFGRWAGALLSAENRRQFWIPVGFAHGIYVLSEWAEVIYKVSDYYAPEWERTIIWNDPQLDIQWPLVDGQPPILLERDAHGSSFDCADKFD